MFHKKARVIYLIYVVMKVPKTLCFQEICIIGAVFKIITSIVYL